MGYCCLSKIAIGVLMREIVIYVRTNYELVLDLYMPSVSPNMLSSC